MNNEQIIALGLIHPALEVRELAEKLMEHTAKGYSKTHHGSLW